MATKTPAKTPAKSARRGRSVPPEAPKKPSFTLTPTDVPGVFRNSSGTLTNEDGIALCLLEAKKADAHDMEAVLGHPVSTPAQFMKAVALDPRVALSTRLEAAKAAAPYTDRKMPSSIDGGVGPEGQPLPVHIEIALPPELMKQLSDAELATFERILALLKTHETKEAT